MSELALIAQQLGRIADELNSANELAALHILVAGGEWVDPDEISAILGSDT